MTDINQEIYEASFKALTECGVPVSTAEKASEVVAKDNSSLPDLGRSSEDQRNIQDAMTWLFAVQRSSSKQQED
jgi:hypothetical protein